MSTSTDSRITHLLREWSNGDQTAVEELYPLVERRLRRLAAGFMNRERHGHTLQTTDLINEAYTRLARAVNNIDWQNRAHFFAVSAQIMRRILVDIARRHHRPDVHIVPIEDASPITNERGADLVALDDALHILSLHDPRKARIVEMRFFGGLSEAEIAEVLKLSERTVRREWRAAKAWLYHEINK
jgi:RNA polymerase sigma-70 factor (ECF subfamily)